MHVSQRLGKVAAVCVSPGGIPKRPVGEAQATPAGILGDGHAHAKHDRADRAVSLLDVEIMEDLVREGFPLVPGAMGENLSLSGVHVQKMPPGTQIRIGDVLLRLEAPRKPCYVLDAIDPRLKGVVVERCGYMASVVRGGALRPGMGVRQVSPQDSHGP
jgi:MOSC domain-containing protein YiiM